ncbi:hypothetical protein KQI86_16020 [Clostridium sp. MSJ-11]|uniref:Uncharacterized protein n=1 Tax=Clostridium mobile TaxID=2841512 RepID=A0ABS6EM48_9CLOT|nr:hypothetical protein [Clostridium mobile]MBU5485827.1 hypothetical protein [Clostridium mobile]
MKKFYMFILTGIMLLITIGAYFYENSYEIPKYSAPTFNIESKKFGTIKEIKPLIYEDDLFLLILGTTIENSEEYSNIYFLNIKDNTTTHLDKFKSHKYLNSYMKISDRFSDYPEIICFYDKGVISFCFDPKILMNDKMKNKYMNNYRVEVKDFEDATTADMSSDLIFAKEGDNSINKFNVRTFNFNPSIGATGSMSNIIYTRPIVSLSYMHDFEHIVSYISSNRGKLSLYEHDLNNNNKNYFKNKPIIEDVIYINPNNKDYIIPGLALDKTSSSEKKISIFYTSLFNNIGTQTLDTIDFNMDKRGELPAVIFSQSKNKDNLIYTFYDENSKGTIRVKNLENNSYKDIISKKDIFGPLRFVRHYGPEKNSSFLLYLIEEDGKTKIKLYNMDEETTEDITDMIL